jgi:dephospho-CoA kinase
MSFCIGLTGSIASGKSTVANIFAQLGVPVISADSIAKELTKINTSAYKAIIAHYGVRIQSNYEELDRRKLRELIFSEPVERLWLEQLLHPLIRQEIKQRVRACKNPYCLAEIPLLQNFDDYPYINKILLINAPIEIQITRVIARDSCSREHALAIIDNQPSFEQRFGIANDIIINDKSINDLTQDIALLHQKYLKESYS